MKALDFKKQNLLTLLLVGVVGINMSWLSFDKSGGEGQGDFALTATVPSSSTSAVPGAGAGTVNPDAAPIVYNGTRQVNTSDRKYRINAKKETREIRRDGRDGITVKQQEYVVISVAPQKTEAGLCSGNCTRIAEFIVDQQNPDFGDLKIGNNFYIGTDSVSADIGELAKHMIETAEKDLIAAKKRKAREDKMKKEFARLVDNCSLASDASFSDYVDDKRTFLKEKRLKGVDKLECKTDALADMDSDDPRFVRFSNEVTNQLDQLLWGDNVDGRNKAYGFVETLSSFSELGAFSIAPLVANAQFSRTLFEEIPNYQRYKRDAQVSRDPYIKFRSQQKADKALYNIHRKYYSPSFQRAMMHLDRPTAQILHQKYYDAIKNPAEFLRGERLSPSLYPDLYDRGGSIQLGATPQSDWTRDQWIRQLVQDGAKRQNTRGGSIYTNRDLLYQRGGVQWSQSPQNNRLGSGQVPMQSGPRNNGRPSRVS